MTTQKITRDKLVQAISELESWERNRKNEGYGSRLSIREEFQLQAYKELLAAMDIEPVHICHDTREFLAELINDALCQDGPTELDNKFAADIEKLLQPVYSVRPASIQVADHMELIEKGRLWLLERAYRTLLDYRADNLWYWQGDQDDQPESLSCPVIMSAETLRELLAKSAPPAPVAVPDEKWVNPDICYADENGFAEGWNACRAAMLKHQSSISSSAGAGCSGEIKQPSSNDPVTVRLEQCEDWGY